MKTFKPTPRAVLSFIATVAALMLGVLPGAANAQPQFAELRGVPEQLGAHNLAMDADWVWATILLLAVIVSLWLFHRRDRRK